jgi:hypothetical protein
MPPKDIRQFKSFFLQQNPNATKAELEELDKFVQQQQVSQMAEMGIPLDDLKTNDQSVFNAQYEQAMKGNFQGSQTAAQVSKDEATNDLERKLSLVESLWFPAEDKLALGKKPKNVLERIAGEFSQKYESSEEYKRYMSTLESMGSGLAKAGGDAGNIAWNEQLVQLKSLARPDVTKEEAENLFRDMRAKFGLEPKKKDYYNALRKGEKPEHIAKYYDNDTLNEITDTPIPPGLLDEKEAEKVLKDNPQAAGDMTMTGGVPSFSQAAPGFEENLQPQLPGAELVQQPQPEQEELSKLQRFMQGFTSAPYTPLSEETMENPLVQGVEKVANTARVAAPIAGNILGRSVAGRPGAVAGAGAGELLGQLIQETMQSATGQQDESPEELLQKMVKNPAQAAMFAAALEGLGMALTPGKSSYNLAKGVAGRSGNAGKTVAGDKIAEAAMNADLRAGYGGAAQKAQLESIEKFAGKEFDPKQLLEIIAKANEAYTKGGGVRSGATNAVNAQIANTGRQLLGEIDPLTRMALRLSSKGYGAQNFASKMIFPTAMGAGIGIPMNIAINKLMGRGD